MALIPTRISSSADAASSVRLDSWKEIAAYLGKVERTVKRWEADRALPIHRVPGGRGSVYAFTNELDEWLLSAKSRELEDQVAAPVALEKDGAGSPVLADPIPVAEVVTEPRLPVGMFPGGTWRVSGFLLLTVCLIGVAGFMSHRRVGVKRNGAGISRQLDQMEDARSSVPSEGDKQQSRDLYLKGRYEWNQRTPESLYRALTLFNDAITHDPENARAYAGLADTYDLLREYSTLPDRDAYSRAIAAARKAVELDDSLSEGHRALAFAEMYGNWDFVGADKEFHRAIELNPKDPIARKWYANAFGMPGRFEECYEQINRAQELDPYSNSIMADKGWFLFNEHRTKEGIDLLKEVERSAPNFLSPHRYLMFIDLEMRNYPDYLNEAERDAEIVNDPVLKDIIASARAGYSRGGERGLLKNLYAKQKEYYLAGKLAATMLAKTCVMMGRKQEALDLLEEAYSRHETFVLAALIHPDLLTLKDEPEYKALVKRINFPAPSTPRPSNLLAGVRAQSLRESLEIH
jgi:tetratricopeptide (TPR) repeat protein